MNTITTREQLAEVFANILFSTPPEFIQFDEIDIDFGHEMIVDGNPETQWYKGCNLTMQEKGWIKIYIPLIRKASVYEYHADRLDEEVKEVEQRVKDLHLMQEMYRDIAESERSRKDANERKRKDADGV